MSTDHAAKNVLLQRGSESAVVHPAAAKFATALAVLRLAVCVDVSTELVRFSRCDE